MVSSRSALNVYGEHEFLVPPLSIPDPEKPGDLDGLRSAKRYAVRTVFAGSR